MKGLLKGRYYEIFAGEDGKFPVGWMINTNVIN